MRIRLRSTGAVMFEDELRAYMRANNGPSWDRTTPEVLETLGADVVFPTPQPAFDPVIRVAREIAPQQTANGNWEQRWEVVPRFTEYTDADGVLHTVAEQEAAAIAADKAERVARLSVQIKAERDRRTQEGGYPAGGKWFHSDTISRTQQIGLILMGASMPADIQWKTMDGSFVTMTPALAQQIFQAAGVQDTQTFAAAQVAIAQATNDPYNFDFAAIAWPAIYVKP